VECESGKYSNSSSNYICKTCPDGQEPNSIKDYCKVVLCEGYFDKTGCNGNFDAVVGGIN
jgi:hypothetical protein